MMYSRLLASSMLSAISSISSFKMAFKRELQLLKGSIIVLFVLK